MITKEQALEYHKTGRPGKIEVIATKPCATQQDLSLAYTPGVAEPCREIQKDPELSYSYTARGNLVGVITDGTAVLGLGNIGPLAGKPVMEGKGVLFKRFADVDVFDIEITPSTTEEFIRTVKSLEPTFGGINLEDIKAPECFIIEETLKREMGIPVFHDDQHGTAIISGAGLINAAMLQKKPLDSLKIVFSGAGAAAISCAKPFQVMPLLVSKGFDTIGWGDEELAIACASHGAEPEHLAIVERMLASIGLEEGDLACGPHEPLSSRGARVWRESGKPLTRLHNNCSGKHTAMLARAVTMGWPTHGYQRFEHQVQRACVGEVSCWSGVPFDDMGVAVDGCSCVVMILPLDRMALAYARLGAAINAGDEVPSRIASAIRAHPLLLGGTERFDTVLLQETQGRVIAKVGAEGVHSVMIPDRRIGFAIKVEDGAIRAQHAAVIDALRQLDVLPELPPKLAEFVRKPVKNTRGEVVGELRLAAERS
jgi:L-asparaginase II